MSKKQGFVGMFFVAALTNSASGSLFEDNWGLDRFNTGNWTGVGNFIDWRDNIEENGDNWLARNGQFFLKAPYGADDGARDAPGFAGIYRGAVGDAVAAEYSFIADSVITEQSWIIKAAIARLPDRDSALQLGVSVGGGSFTIVDISSVFHSGSGGDIFVPASSLGFGADGPMETRTVDLSDFKIEPGDRVTYRIDFALGRHIGLGVAFVDLPISVFADGGSGLWSDQSKWSDGVPSIAISAYIHSGVIVQHEEGDIVAGRLSVGAWARDASTDPSGTMHQLGGKFTIASELRMAGQGTSRATYILEGGVLLSEAAKIGIRGSAIFVQSGGVYEVASLLDMAMEKGSTAEYTLSGGELLIGQGATIGHDGQALFTLLHGEVTVNSDLRIGQLGELIQSGGNLDAGSMEIRGKYLGTGGTLDTDLIVIASEHPMAVQGVMFTSDSVLVTEGSRMVVSAGTIITDMLIVDEFSSAEIISTSISANDVQITSGGQLDLQNGTIDGKTVRLVGGFRTPVAVRGYGTLLGKFDANHDSHIEVTEGTLNIGDASQWQAFVTQGTILIHADAELALASRGVSVLGRTTTLDGGTLSSANGIFLPAGALLTGHGLINSRIETAGGSMLVLNFDLEAGDASAVDGFAADGRIFVGQHTLTLRDQNRAGLGLLTELGDSGQAGTLVADNGLDIAFGRNLTGYGTVVTPNDPFAAVVNNGSITGDSIFQPITMTGYVKGVGQFDKVAFTGTFSPGLSPAVVYVGDLIFTESSVTIMELAGTGFGEYDRLISSGTLLLGGTLQVELLGGFVPVEGDVFELFTGNLVEGFSQIILPQLGEGLYWDTSLINTAGTLSVIPEPASLALLGLGGVALLRRRVG